MKPWKTGIYLVGAILIGLGVTMAATNPDESAYEHYATLQLTDYLRQNTCRKAGAALQKPCNELLEQNQSQIQKFIAENTDRQNYGLFSIYKTNLSLDPLLPPFVSSLVPSYHFETVALFNSFSIYKAKKQ